MPFTLPIDPVEPETARRVTQLAEVCGLTAGAGAADLRTLAGEARRRRARARTWRGRSRWNPRCWFSSIRPPITGGGTRRLAADIVKVADARRLALLLLTQDQAFAQKVAHRTLKWNPATGGLTPVRRVAVLLIRYLAMTPQATLGPPLTPDFGSPVCPGLVPVNDDGRAVGVEERQRPRQSVTRVVSRQLARSVGVDLEVRHVAHVEGMIGVGVHVAGRPGIEVAARGGEVGVALADRVQVDAMHAGFETLHSSVNSTTVALPCLRSEGSACR